ncbi:SLC13 family permease [Kocuria carniphila]|uniref:Sodium-dependent dicarboxylate transporter SdcS n=1 Tax=Kocuria carniphila TaxID=262208 RepID=A0ABV3V4C9_9MICC
MSDQNSRSISSTGMKQSPGMAENVGEASHYNRRLIGVFGGIALGALVYILMPSDLPHETRVTAAIGILMGVWWVSEAVPIPVTALTPLVLFPALSVAPLEDIAPSYASDIIFLFMGGFLLALTMERWNLHYRIALNVVLRVGTKPTRLVAGFMLATALLSMWVSNTATAMMMIPMGMAVVKMVEERRIGLQKNSKFGIALVLGIAYGATIGSFGTMLGSPANLIVVGYLRESLGVPVTFLQWMLVGVPVMIVMYVLGVLVLTKWVWRPEVDELSGGRELFESELAGMGRMSTGERMIAVIFGSTAICWIALPLIFPGTWITDGVVAMTAGLLTFMMPVRPSRGVMLMDWKSAEKLPWGILLLFGGGLALSSQITGTGLSAWIGDAVAGLGALPVWLILCVMVAVLLMLTEFTSSTATVAAFVPVVGGIAVGIGADPTVFVVAAGIACMCAFMLPVGTPPNAIAFASGAVTMQQMVRTGIYMNIGAIFVVLAAGLFLVPPVF